MLKDLKNTHTILMALLQVNLSYPVLPDSQSQVILCLSILAGQARTLSTHNSGCVRGFEAETLKGQESFLFPNKQC